jgi:hypothetical protein
MSSNSKLSKEQCGARINSGLLHYVITDLLFSKLGNKEQRKLILQEYNRLMEQHGKILESMDASLEKINYESINQSELDESIKVISNLKSYRDLGDDQKAEFCKCADLHWTIKKIIEQELLNIISCDVYDQETKVSSQFGGKDYISIQIGIMTSIYKKIYYNINAGLLHYVITDLLFSKLGNKEQRKLILQEYNRLMEQHGKILESMDASLEKINYESINQSELDESIKVISNLKSYRDLGDDQKAEFCKCADLHWTIKKIIEQELLNIISCDVYVPVTKHENEFMNKTIERITISMNRASMNTDRLYESNMEKLSSGEIKKNDTGFNEDQISNSKKRANGVSANTNDKVKQDQGQQTKRKRSNEDVSKIINVNSKVRQDHTNDQEGTSKEDSSSINKSVQSRQKEPSPIDLVSDSEDEKEENGKKQQSNPSEKPQFKSQSDPSNGFYEVLLKKLGTSENIENGKLRKCYEDFNKYDGFNDDERKNVSDMNETDTIKKTLLNARYDSFTASNATIPLTDAVEGNCLEDARELKFDITINKETIIKLRPGVWLNDEIVNFYMKMLQKRDDDLVEKYPSRDPSYYFNSFFIAKLLDEGGYKYKNVKNWSERAKINIFKMNKIFFPVNISNNHWTMAVIYMKKKQICYYDSFHETGERYLKGLLHYIVDEGNKLLKKKYIEDDEAKQLNLPVDRIEWSLIPFGENSPIQRNGLDCGVFSIMCADFLSDDLPLLYDKKDMIFFRLKICAAIMNGSLDYPLLVNDA